VPEEKSKAVMLARLATERRRLEKNLEGLSREQLLTQDAVGHWALKDLLAHIAEWEACMPRWMEQAREGRKVITPDEDLTWKQLDEFNQRVYLKYRDWPLEQVQAFFHDAHAAFMDMVSAMPEEEMLTPGFHAFTGKSAVYNWLAAYAQHDRWAKGEVRQWRKRNMA
jgi:hypothetical protein